MGLPLSHLASSSLLCFCFRDFPHKPQPKHRGLQIFSWCKFNTNEDKLLLFLFGSHYDFQLNKA